MLKTKRTARIRRKISIRKKIFGTATRPRLSVFRSNFHIYAQLIDDEQGKTLLSASSNTKDFQAKIKADEKIVTKKDVAFVVGEELGKKIIEASINELVFDRNGYLYHGRVKSLADGVRKAGVKF